MYTESIKLLLIDVENEPTWPFNAFTYKIKMNFIEEGLLPTNTAALIYIRQ